MGIHWNSGRTSAIPRAKKVSMVKKITKVAATNVPKKIRASGEPK